MMDHRTGKWAAAILAEQKPDGTWPGTFHGLALPGKGPLTTEQALRRLHALGFTIAAEPIRRIVNTMASCLRGERKIDTYWETIKTVEFGTGEGKYAPRSGYVSVRHRPQGSSQYHPASAYKQESEHP